MSRNRKQTLRIEKFQISKIRNPQCIIGGGDPDPDPEKTRPALGVLAALDTDYEIQDI